MEIQHQSEMELLADIVTFIKEFFNQSEIVICKDFNQSKLSSTQVVERF